MTPDLTFKGGISAFHLVIEKDRDRETKTLGSPRQRRKPVWLESPAEVVNPKGRREEVSVSQRKAHHFIR